MSATNGFHLSPADSVMPSSRSDPPGAPATNGYRFALADDRTVWPDGAGGTDALLGLPERERLSAIEPLSTGGRRLVVLVRAAQATAVRGLAAGARSLFDSRIAVVEIDRGPAPRAAAALIGQVMTAAPFSRPATEIIAALPHLCDQLAHVVLLGSVKKVDHPSVGFLHHLRSYVPGRKLFVLQTAPAPAIALINGKGAFRPVDQRFLPPAYDESFGHCISVLGPRPVPGELLDRMAVSGPEVPVPVSTPPSTHWPDPEATEIVVLPQNVGGWVTQQLPQVPSWPCHWCAEPLVAPIRVCPFCGNTV